VQIARQLKKFLCHIMPATPGAAARAVHCIWTCICLRARGKKAAARFATGCARVTSAHISALWRKLCELGKDGEERWQTIGECFYSICQKMKDEEEGSQTVGVALIRSGMSDGLSQRRREVGLEGARHPPTFCLVCNITSCLATNYGT
jgi:hypothetical protein